MFFSVPELQLRKIPFRKLLQPGEIAFLEPDLRQRTPLDVVGTAELTGPGQQIRVRGHVKGEVECACDRCLEPVSVGLDGTFDLLYRPADDEEISRPEAGLSDEESEVGFYEGNGIELAEVIREHVLLALPMRRICRDECKGICPICGSNRNQGECGCRTEEVDERWKALREL
jgi:uncharacterized protein